MIRVCALDFDGIVLESVSVKLNAFGNLFSSERQGPEAAAYFRENNGLDRYTKFRHVWTKILGRSYSPEIEGKLDTQFNAMVLDAVIRCPFVPGAKEFIHSCKLPMYVISASPERDLIRIIEERGLTPFFRGLYGSPGKKADQLREVAEKEGVPTSSIIFVGDSPKDLAAARAAGTPFIGRRNTEPFSDTSIPLLDDLRNLSSEIEAIASPSL